MSYLRCCLFCVISCTRIRVLYCLLRKVRARVLSCVQDLYSVNAHHNHVEDEVVFAVFVRSEARREAAGEDDIITLFHFHAFVSSHVTDAAVMGEDRPSIDIRGTACKGEPDEFPVAFVPELIYISYQFS